MPLVRIDIAGQQPESFGTAVGEIVHKAMVATINVPADDKFQIIQASGQARFNMTASYLGLTYSPNMIVLQITLNGGRTVEMKKALYHKIAEDLHTQLSVRREDVVINLVEVTKENWSFGNGEMQYGPTPA